MNDQYETKSSLRTTFKNRRNQLTATEQASFSKTICENLLSLPEVVNAESFFIYISCNAEVTTHGLIDRLLSQHKTLAVPKIESKTMIAVPFQSWDECRPGQLGILTPMSSNSCKAQIEVAITPGLAFTRSGIRLGFGAGYYDKWFASHHVGTKIAVAFACQVTDFLPQDDYDIPVDIIVTEQEIIDAKKNRQLIA